MSKTTETVEIDNDTLKAISDQVAESLDIESVAEKAATAAAEAAVAKMEKPEAKKSIVEDEDKEEAAEKATKKTTENPLAKESKELRLFKAAKAFSAGDLATVRGYRKLSFELREKAGYANTGDNEDGGYLVPDPEFDTTVYENLPKYGVAFQFADVRQTDRTAVKVLSLASGLSFYATDEAGVKQSGKLQFSRKTVDLQKYAVIVPATDELADDSAVDYWNLVTKELSRAYAKLADEVTFTDAVSGITNTNGVIIETIGSNGTDITWDDLLSAEGNTEDDLDTSNARWFMRKEVWYFLCQTKADGEGQDGHYYFQPNPNNPTTPWGTPISFTRVLPKTNGIGANDPLAVYGDLSNYILYNKRGMAMKMLTEATIVDEESNDFNLATQDGTAMRAVVRMLGVLPQGNASKFVVLGTGTVS